MKRFRAARSVFTGSVQLDTLLGKPHATRIRKALILLIVILSGWLVVPAQSPSKEIAVTIDDLPLNGPRFDLARMQTMTTRLLAEIRGQNVPVVGFVNESLLYVPNETDARIALLEQWAAAGLSWAIIRLRTSALKIHLV
jgi:hypothetical protein